MNYQPWTDAEVRTAQAMRGKHSDREIGETLERSRHSVQKMFKRLDGGEGVGRGVGRSVAAPSVPDGIAKRLGVGATVPKAVTPVTKTGTLESVLIVSDAHIPYHSRVWWDLLLQVGRALAPQHIVIIGDFADFYSVSDHDKDPERANRMDEELVEVEKCLDEIDALGARDKLYIEGNHEDRLRRHLMKNPALARVVSTERLLRLKERGWEFVPYKRHASRGAVHFTHDVGAAGRNAVFRALDVYGHSVVSGHTHRLAYIVEGTATGECKLSATFGWGGDVEQVDYMCLAKARKDWALGLGIGYLEPSSGFVYLSPVPIVHGTCVVNGQLFRAAVT
jgi:UDP-2,3-diacylglucosamine pyrophosphatase LpxH